ncbi:heparinase II/III family protein [Kribbella sp. NBC_01484]|uniref:heparinase II/III family protein n=1 Tax=Kribbella sp. NBC_01484 TaxID=2903579 RepID=UPI002E350725|nr:heparinase II/III family protein [Kribbella sp. NBC_01484]
MNATSGPEKPRHIDHRINRIGTDDLIKAFGSPPGVHDLGTLRSFVADHMQRPAWPLREWVEAIRSTPAVEAVLTEAAPLLTGVDVTGSEHGRSRRYGFHYLGWLSPGVPAWLLTGDDRYLYAFEKHLDEWVDRHDSVTGEWPGLDVIWYSLGTWARCRNLLPTLEVLTDSALSDQAWGRLVATLVGGARWAHDEHDVFRHGNWQLVCATELLHISTVLPDLVEAGVWASRARARIDEHLLLDVYADGGHYERSPGYHKMCLTALQTAAVIDADVAAHPKVAAMHDWLGALVSRGGWIPHLQDSHIEWPATSLLRGSYVLDDPTLARIAALWLTPDEFASEAAMLPAWEDAARQQRWTDTLAAAREGLQEIQPALPRSTVLPDSGYVILRGDDLRAVINYGPHIEHELESHSHRAVLDLVLDGWQRPLLWEAGSPPSYDDPEYLTWYQSGRGHNTVLVDDRELGTDRGVTVDPLVDTEKLAVFSGHHRGNGLPQSRTIAMVREEPAFVVVSDSSAEESHIFRACWHSLYPWREVEPLTYDASSADGPGLLLVEVGNPSTTAAETSEGTARRPLVDRRTAEYGSLHSLVLKRDTGVFTTVLVPHATAEQPNVRVTRDDGELTIDHGHTVDRVGPSAWVRTKRTHLLVEMLSWATGWRVQSLLDRGRPLLRTSEDVDATATVVDGALQLEVTCTGRCGLWIWPTGDIRLDGVLVTPEPADDGWAHLTLPYTGRWTVQGARHD